MILQNDHLKVEIARPGTIYSGSRFDWSAFITQVTLDERHSFCVAESLIGGEGTGGIGLCNEFGLYRPIGYDEAQPGEKFPKLGIGLLTRADANPYDFAAPYEIEPFPWRVEEREDCIVFEVEPLDCRGYAARERKTVSLHENRLSVAYELKNVGHRVLETHEYCHNFVSIDGHAPGLDYTLQLADGLSLPNAELPSLLSRNGQQWRWKANVEEDFLCTAMGPFSVSGAAWQLRHEPSGVTMRETVSLPIARFGLWCAPHVVSCEAFIDIDLQPGDRQTWTRDYEFMAS